MVLIGLLPLTGRTTPPVHGTGGGVRHVRSPADVAPLILSDKPANTNVMGIPDDDVIENFDTENFTGSKEIEGAFEVLG